MRRLLPLLVAFLLLCLALDRPAFARVEAGYAGYVCGEDGDRCDRDPRVGAVIVFVHGLQGNALETWEARPARGARSATGRELKAVYWPGMLRSFAQDTATANVYVLEYDSGWIGSSSPRTELSKFALEKLKLDRVFEHRVILFVTHSLGGQVINEALNVWQKDAAKDLENRKRTIRVFSLSTPWSGTERLAQLEAALLANSPAAAFAVKAALSRLAREAAAYRGEPVKGVGYTCLWEREPLFLTVVVERESAVKFCANDNAKFEIPRDHIRMAKPFRTNDRQNVYLQSLFRSVAVPNGSDVTTATFSFQSEGHQGIFCGVVQTFQAQESGQPTEFAFRYIVNDTANSKIGAKLWKLKSRNWDDRDGSPLWTLGEDAQIGRIPKPIVHSVDIRVAKGVELVQGEWYALQIWEDKGSPYRNANLYREDQGDFFEGRLYERPLRTNGGCDQWREVPASDIGFALRVRR